MRTSYNHRKMRKLAYYRGVHGGTYATFDELNWPGYDKAYRAGQRRRLCPRPINTARNPTTVWCVNNGHCGCGMNHNLGIRKGFGYDHH